MNRKSRNKESSFNNFITKNMMIKVGIFSSVISLFGLTKLSLISSQSKPQIQVYIAYELKTEKAVNFVTDINDKFVRTNLEYPMNVDILKARQISNIYGISSQGSLRDIGKDLQIIRSDDQALIQAINRVKGLINEKQELHAFIVSEGTNDKSTIKQIQNIAQEIAKKKPTNFHLYLMGVNPDFKIEFSDAFHSIREIVHSCPNTQYEQCSAFIEKLE
ncbi:hypothetical protein [Nostoc sp. ChiQUE01b]|uniref:hypothetical protein n=1 Tax=Nostoc sp. ChiQUE01b TaxID=3075376 RepID=UPI002AD4CDD7|nr:hypothetical protein [Nostoc sp. ChiQUE01b]MDZ8260948.1 hypothetical protein [Nostoc sp. ChiQUE01b]